MSDCSLTFSNFSAI